MNFYPINLLLADDAAKEGCLHFKKALEELPLSSKLPTVNDGEQLMQLLLKKVVLPPSVLFPKLSMSRKNGSECLTEMKGSERFKNLPVIIFSTSFDPETINLLYQKGAQYYVRKPPEFLQLKKVINDAPGLITKPIAAQPGKKKFVPQP